MNIKVQLKPLSATSYTDKGNSCREYNIGKYTATGTIAGAGAVFAGKFAFRKAEELCKNAKTIKMKFPKVKKTNLKTIRESAEGTFENLKKVNIPSKKSNLANCCVDFVKKISLDSIKKAPASALDFIKSNVNKINKENIKKAVESLTELIKKPSIKKAAGIAAAITGIIVAGAAIDVVLNKISAHKADKKA